MTIANRLRLSLALVAALLAAVMLLQVASMRRAGQGTRALAGLAARQQTAAGQLHRLDEMSIALRKYEVTSDVEYVERIAGIAHAHDEQMRALEVQSMTPTERAALAGLAMQWESLSLALDSIVIDARLGRPGVSATRARRIAADIDALRGPTEALASAARFATLDEIQRADRRSMVTTRLSWSIAAGALVLFGLLARLLLRSITGPLARLAAATRAVAGGRLGVVVPAAGRDEIAMVAHDFNDMSARLAQLDRMKRDFISNVSHDLKSPLAAIRETNDVVLEGLAGPVSDRQRRLLEMSRDSGRRLASMIHKLLDLSRLDSRPTPVRELLDLSALTQRAVDHADASRNARARGPSVVLDPSSAHLLLRADAEEISQLLDNLLENAIKFSPENGVVRVALDDDDGAVVLRVADQGPGVPDVEKRRIFERFYQTDAGRATSDHGVGLGLAICRDVVEAHDGAISVRDNSPAGAVFEVRIPGAITVPASDAPTPAEMYV